MDYSNTNTNDLVLILNLKDRKGREVRVSDCKTLDVKVYTQDPRYFAIFHKRDVTQGDRHDKIVIPSYMIDAIPSGVLKYDYEFTANLNGIPTEYSNTVTTDIYWRNTNVNGHGEPKNNILNYRSYEYLRNLVESEAVERERQDDETRAMITGDLIAKLDHEIRRSNKADIQLSNEIKEVNENLSNNFADLKEKVDSFVQESETKGNETEEKIEETDNRLQEEIDRATKREDEIEANLNKVTQKATNQIKNLKQDLNAEVTRSKGEEQRIENLAKSVANDLDSEVSRAKSKENEIVSKVQQVETDLQNLTSRSNENDIQHKQDIEQLKADVEHIKGEDFGSILHALEDSKHYTDDKVNELKSGLATEISADLQEEINRAKAEESRLDSKIDATNINVDLNKQAIDKLNNDLSNYATKSEVDGRIEGIIGSAPEAYDTLGKIAEELQKNDSVHEAINAVLTGKADKADVYTKNEVDNQFNTYSNALTNEVNRAQSAESGLSDSIASETSARQSADQSLEAKIKANSDAIEALQNADNNQALNEEISRAKSAESGLADSIATETTNRENADNAINARIDTLEGNVSTIEGKVSENASNIAQNTSDIAGEVTRATNRENEIEAQVKLNTEAIESIRKADNSEALQKEIVERKAEDIRIEGLITAETNRATNAEQVLETSINGVNADLTNVKADVNINTGDIVAIKARLDVVQGDEATAGSIAHGVADSKHYTDDEIAKLKLEQGADVESKLGDYAKKEYVDERFTELVGTAPSNLDTLGELAQALNDQNDVVAGIVTTIASKASAEDLEAEVNRAKGVESGLTAKDAELEASVTTERNRAIAAEDSLSVKVTANTEAINQEVTDRKAEIIRVEGLINSTNSDLTDVKGSIQEEVQRAKLAEQGLQAAIDVVNGGEEVVGSIAHAVADCQHLCADAMGQMKSEFASKEDLENVKSEIEKSVEEKVNESVEALDLSQYETKENAEATYQPKGDYLTEHQDLSEYAKTSEVNSAIESAKQELEEKIADVDITDQLEDYAKKSDIPTDFYSKSETDEKIADAISKVDHTAYATKEEISDMATQSWVEEQEYLKEHQSLEGLATKAEVEQVKSELEQKIEDIDVTDQLTDYAKKSDIPSVEDFVTNEELDEKLEDYAKKEDVCNINNGEGQQITEIVISDDDEEADTVEVYSKAQVDQKINAVKDSIPKISEPMTQDEYDRLGEYDPKTLYVIIG